MCWKGSTTRGSIRRSSRCGLKTLAATAKRNPHVRAFLFWSRMPMIVVDGRRAFLTDQRFYENRRRIRATPFLIPLDNRGSSS